MYMCMRIGLVIIFFSYALGNIFFHTGICVYVYAYRRMCVDMYTRMRVRMCVYTYADAYYMAYDDVTYGI